MNKGVLIGGSIIGALAIFSQTESGQNFLNDFGGFLGGGSDSGTYGVNPKDETPAPKKEADLTNLTTPTNDINYSLVNPNLAIATDKNGVLLGGQSFYTNQSLTSKGAKIQAEAVKNPIAQIALNPTLSKKKTDAKVINEFQNTTKQSTTLTSSQISSYNYLTKKKILG